MKATVVKPSKPKIPSLDSKVGKYFIAIKSGKSSKEAQKIAGYSTKAHQSTHIENSKQFGALQVYFKDELLKKIPIEQLADELKKNIIQDQDKGAKNTAIKMALDKIEPEQNQGDDSQEVLVVIS